MADRKKLGLWHPRNDGKGAAAIIEVNEKGQFWLTFLPQGGAEGKKFNTDKKLTAKLGLNDLGEFLTILRGKKDGIGDKNDKGFFSGILHKIKGSEDSTIIGLSQYIDANKVNRGYTLSLSAKRKGEVSRLSMGLTLAEGELLEQIIIQNISGLFANEPLVEPEAEPQQA